MSSTVVLDKKVDLNKAQPEPAAEESSADLASWLARAGAFVVDVAFGLGVVATMAVLQAASPQGGALWWIYVSIAVLAVIAVVVNRCVLPSIRGWSLGRALFGIAVVHRDGTSVGPLRMVSRELAHLLDTAAVGIGWLWPLWDRRNRTFADLLTRVEVHRVEKNGDWQRPAVRKLAAIVVAVAALLCTAGVGLNYVVVFRHEQAVDQAYAEITEQGPGIVEQILSYGADSQAQDFARAQSLVTEGYRAQLVEQQLSVASAAPFTNEFWTVNSAVLSATPDTASMLVMMQGRRATNDTDARFITATVRALFEKGGDGQWLLSDLNVLTKPLPRAEPQK